MTEPHLIRSLWARLLNSAACSRVWLAVLALCIALEAGALFYQHVLDYYPCELCIYVRVWLMALAVVALLALWLKRWQLGRAFCAATALALSVGLAHETWLLFQVEYGLGHGTSCGFRANFPEWAPLDAWLPPLFEVQGLCQATPEIVPGITMTHVLALVSLALVALFSAALAGTFKKAR